MKKDRILWADDEIDLLKPYILFLNDKGYDVHLVNSGADALHVINEELFDLVFLDENMPGLSGLETLNQLKISHPNLPVVMITKSEEESIMEEAIGAKIADYLIKPLNPNQILLSVKKILDNKHLVSEKTNLNYQQEFRNISMTINEGLDYDEWAEVYKKMVYWELNIDETEEKDMAEIFKMQKDEANKEFAKFIKLNYINWLEDGNHNKPMLSHQIIQKEVLPYLESETSVFFILIDNLRYDQWEVLEPEITDLFNIDKKQHYYSILPTTTAYARNAIFSGMFPDEMSKNHSDLWIDETIDGGKNNYEEVFLERNLQKQNNNIKFSYNKILSVQEGKKLIANVNNLKTNNLNAVVYNFVDMLSHARTDMKMIRELVPDESAYRSLTKSWFLHSKLYDFLKVIAREKGKVIITTDHGTIRVKQPFKIIGDKNTNTNLRYKVGKNLSYENENDVFHSGNPNKLRLPKPNVSSSYVFATNNDFFVYPNNFNHYVNFYKDTFQHGGVSLEELILPLVHLSAK